MGRPPVARLGQHHLKPGCAVPLNHPVNLVDELTIVEPLDARPDYSAPGAPKHERYTVQIEIDRVGVHYALLTREPEILGLVDPREHPGHPCELLCLCQAVVIPLTPDMDIEEIWILR